MALLDEQLVEEWLNRQNFFTMRGIKCGVDLIAYRQDLQDVCAGSQNKSASVASAIIEMLNFLK
jgi:hypothetical protein